MGASTYENGLSTVGAEKLPPWRAIRAEELSPEFQRAVNDWSPRRHYCRFGGSVELCDLNVLYLLLRALKEVDDE